MPRSFHIAALVVLALSGCAVRQAPSPLAQQPNTFTPAEIRAAVRVLAAVTLPRAEFVRRVRAESSDLAELEPFRRTLRKRLATSPARAVWLCRGVRSVWFDWEPARQRLVYRSSEPLDHREEKLMMCQIEVLGPETVAPGEFSVVVGDLHDGIFSLGVHPRTGRVAYYGRPIIDPPPEH